MFTPEFSTADATEHTLVANHYVETQVALNLSVAFVRARVLFGRQHVPLPAARFVVVYDVRGQKVEDDLEGCLHQMLGDVAEIRVQRA